MKTLTLSLLTIAAASGLFAQGNGYSTNYHQEAFTRCLSEVRYSGTDRYRAYNSAMPQVSDDAKLWVKGLASLGSALGQVQVERTDNKLYNYCMQQANVAAAAQIKANDQYNRREELKIVSENQLANTQATTQRMGVLINGRLEAVRQCPGCNVEEATRLADGVAPRVIGGNVFTEVDDSAFRAGKIDVNGRPIGQTADIAPAQNRSNLSGQPAGQPRIVSRSN